MIAFFGVMPPFVFWLSFGFISGVITLPLNGGLYVFAFCYSEVATLGRIEARTGGWHSPLRDKEILLTR